jgi:Topoisomerase DNA binding C4 zinc finger
MADNSKYVAVPEAAMRALMESECGFEQIKLDGTTELVFQRDVVSSKGKEFPYAVRVYSSVAYGETRAVGEDAIRVILMNTTTNRPVKIMGEGRKNRDRKSKAGSRIYRTAPTGIPTEERVAELLGRLKTRCREYFYHVVANQCPKCDSALSLRHSKGNDFYGCTNFPECKHTQSEVKSYDS